MASRPKRKFTSVLDQEQLMQEFYAFGHFLRSWSFCLNDVCVARTKIP